MKNQRLQGYQESFASTRKNYFYCNGDGSWAIALTKELNTSGICLRTNNMCNSAKDVRYKY